MNKKIIALVIGALVIIGAITATVIIINQPQSNTTEQQTTKKLELVNNELSYQGKEGITALALLEENATIVTSGTGEMAYVTTINGVLADSTKEYWQFIVNGESASVGAGSYVTKDSDTITWKLTTF